MCHLFLPNKLNRMSSSSKWISEATCISCKYLNLFSIRKGAFGCHLESLFQLYQLVFTGAEECTWIICRPDVVYINCPNSDAHIQRWTIFSPKILFLIKKDYSSGCAFASDHWNRRWALSSVIGCVRQGLCAFKRLVFVLLL